ncbi:phosphate ABC transporter ATP-binding protein PstB [Aphanothece sacrum]|uniref:High-affinity phosphate transport protein n=1 Tax=Aphanothece sacrum FPU1 TaxID=1920663 RepID=A0A401IDH4_APHSA|nr:phosphate ABC transporter ATP-binding protein PstB [Aphanothece sacrum]GBF79353.1 high-affinity phosphate transport protein [Aphanothece sacrum FPU1]GBF86855.1 High-affinity phosphate transport protein [Aphanothece sacrum FPU3]
MISTTKLTPNTQLNSSALLIENVNFWYGTKQALTDISLNIPQEKVTAMIGPSGCGKSTLLKSLNRIGELEGKVKVTGSIRFLGQDIYHKRVNINTLRRQIGMVFQRPNPFATSIYENIAYGIRIFRSVSRGELDAQVESALQGAALWEEVKDSLNKSALGLSGGQQQRLCIARALAVNPKVLLMDEPCSALDPLSTLKIEELIHGLKTHLTIIIVTHNMQQASRVSDYTAFFNTDESRIGKLIEFGTTEKIFTDANHSQTRDYVAGRFG